MKSSGFLTRVLVGAMLLLSTDLFAANHGSLQLAEQVTVNGQSLQAGEYQVKWDGDGPNLDLRILRDGKLVATVPAHTIELPRKESQDSVLTRKNNDGTWSISEIHFGGKRYAFAFGNEQSQVNSNGANSK